MTSIMVVDVSIRQSSFRLKTSCLKGGSLYECGHLDNRYYCSWFVDICLEDTQNRGRECEVKENTLSTGVSGVWNWLEEFREVKSGRVSIQKIELEETVSNSHDNHKEQSKRAHGVSLYSDY